MFPLFLLIATIEACLVTVQPSIGHDISDCLKGLIPCQTISYPLKASSCDLYLREDSYFEPNITIARNVTIEADRNMIMYQSNFLIIGGDNVKLSRLTMVNCTQSCIYVNISLTLHIKELTVLNTTNSVPAALCYHTYNGSGSVSIEKSRFENNGNRRSCGILFFMSWFDDDFNVTIKYSTFINNTGDGGGAIAHWGIKGVLNVWDSVFIGNTAQQAGGAIDISGLNSGSTFRNLLFINNSAPLGGAIMEEFSNVLYDNVTFEGNSGKHGGAIGLRASISTFQNVNFRFNNASKEGGAIYIFNGNVYLDQITMFGNEAPNGSGIYCVGASLVLTDTNISDTLVCNNCGLCGSTVAIPIVTASSSDNDLASKIGWLVFVFIVAIGLSVLAYFVTIKRCKQPYEKL